MMGFTLFLSVFMFGATAFVVFSRKNLNALIALSIFSMILVVYYFLLHAPDVAITEAALGAGFSTMIFLIAIRKIKEERKMVDLSDYFRETNVVRIESKKSEVILKTLVDTCLSSYPESFRENIISRVIEKGNNQEINLGHGIALTHERFDELDGIYTALGLLPRTVRYFRGPPVHTVVCILLPNTKSQEYLSMMARFTRFLTQHPPDQTAPSADPEKIVQAIRDFETSEGS
jgi:uncharacterized MnhB-related membrane protein/mannitol/fructose-specific phosphotransferase system IIA component (Ntr-type)